MKYKKFKEGDMTDQDAYDWFASLSDDGKYAIEKTIRVSADDHMDRFIAQVLFKYSNVIADWKSVQFFPVAGIG